MSRHLAFLLPSAAQVSGVAIANLRQQLRIDQPFILAVGNLEPRKNLESLVEAYARLAADIPHDLVLAGAVGWKADSLVALLNDPRLENRVHLPGYLEPSVLPALYAAADLFVIPSWYEGFGLTMLEAMACGTPVIASDRGSLPEVAGNAAILVDPQPQILAQAIESTLADPDLRHTLSAAGRSRAARLHLGGNRQIDGRVVPESCPFMSETVADIGEFGSDRTDRRRSQRDFPIGRADLLLGIGDDAAIWRPAPDEDIVITTDSLIERVHFRLDWTDWESLGWKALAVNLSDMAGMGAIPALARSRSRSPETNRLLTSRPFTGVWRH